MSTPESSEHPDTPVTRAIAEAGVAHEVRVIERARSLEEAAERLRADPERLLKTLVVHRGDEDHRLVLVPGSRQTDRQSSDRQSSPEVNDR